MFTASSVPSGAPAMQLFAGIGRQQTMLTIIDQARPGAGH